MNVYISHSRRFDYKKDLYTPIQTSELMSSHHFIFPHEKSESIFPTKELFREKGCDLVIAEVSFASTSQGIELGWADLMGIPIVCIYRQGMEIAGSLSLVSSKFLMYPDTQNMIEDVRGLLKQYE